MCIPADTVYAAQLGSGDERWKGHPSIMEDLKVEARKRGLFNMFLPKNHFKEGAGFTNLEYGLMAEQLGKSRTASEVSCSRLIFLSTPTMLMCHHRPPIAPLQTPETWRLLQDMGLRLRKISG